MKNPKRTTKATNKLKDDDLEAWMLQKRDLALRYRKQREADVSGQGSSFSESQARSAAKKVGLRAHKSRSQHIGNLDGFQLLDPKRAKVVAGERYDMTPLDVINFCATYGQNKAKTRRLARKRRLVEISGFLPEAHNEHQRDQERGPAKH